MLKNFRNLGGEISLGQKVINIQEKNGITTVTTNKRKF